MDISNPPSATAGWCYSTMTTCKPMAGIDRRESTLHQTTTTTTTVLFNFRHKEPFKFIAVAWLPIMDFQLNHAIIWPAATRDATLTIQWARNLCAMVKCVSAGMVSMLNVLHPWQFARTAAERWPNTTRSAFQSWINSFSAGRSIRNLLIVNWANGNGIWMRLTSSGGHIWEWECDDASNDYNFILTRCGFMEFTFLRNIVR